MRNRRLDTHREGLSPDALKAIDTWERPSTRRKRTKRWSRPRADLNHPRTARACRPRLPHAAPEHWLLGDWLAARVPVGVRGRTTGTRCTFGGLAARAGVSDNYLRWIRGTAHHWPPETRVPAAPFHVHGALRDGGRERAGRRRDRLLGTERYTAESLRRWREAHAEYVPSRGARRAPIRQTELAEEVDALARRADRAIRAGAPAVGQKAGRGVT